MATFILVHGTWAKSEHWPILQDALAETSHAAGDEPVFEQLTGLEEIGPEIVGLQLRQFTRWYKKFPTRFGK